MPQKIIKEIKAVLFDLDGVIIDSNQAIINAWVTTAQEYGYNLTQDDIDNYIIGASHHFTLQHILPGETEVVRKTFHQKVDRREEEANYVLIKGVREFIFQLKKSTVKIGLVTSSWPEKVGSVITQHQLNVFDCIITRNDVSKGKPDPQPYQMAIEKLNIDPEFALAFEDSNNGIASASSAGIKSIAVNNKTAKSFASISDFTEITVGQGNLLCKFYGEQNGIRWRANKG
ncbi:HAD superfamily hydrolase (TIGR01509 family) [Pantoea alhagi]|nr:HAD superfamily hydrolase (TIGR01509 family) [Pantoea alhagi]